MKQEIIKELQTIYDPEIPVNIYDLGLVYEINIDSGNVDIKMTLTSPMCPAAQYLPEAVRQKVTAVKGVKKVDVEIVWDPPWSYGLMSEAAKLELGVY
ncbi:DUF59 domain-containing protein [candidate division KSB1 bacterium]|nr:DUF59 domain-containing protein [candidate division KSB1 bacterium]